MAKFEIRLQALQLRRLGKSINGIAEELGVSKGTASVWCRDIVLTPAQRLKLVQNSIKGGHLGRMKGAAANHQKKLDIVARSKKDAQHEVGYLEGRDLLIAATALYWAEGSKTESRFVFVNSDPSMVLLMCKFIREHMHVSDVDVFLTIQINEIHQPRIEQVLKFWSKYLNIPSTQFKQTYFIKSSSKKIYENYDTYHGTARLSVAKGSVLQYRMLGYISALKEGNLLA